MVNVERAESGELATVLGRLIPVDVADCMNPETGFDPVKTAAGIDRIKGVTVGEGVITVESEELAAVLGRLTGVEVALCWTVAVGVLKPEEPVEPLD